MFFDNPIRTQRTHDVAEAYRLAMSDVRVRLPLGAFGVKGNGGPRALGARLSGFDSRLPDSIAVGPVLVRAGGC